MLFYSCGGLARCGNALRTNSNMLRAVSAAFSAFILVISNIAAGLEFQQHLLKGPHRFL